MKKRMVVVALEFRFALGTSSSARIAAFGNPNPDSSDIMKHQGEREE